MGLSTLFLLIFTILFGIFSFILLGLNKSVVHVDLLLYEFDLSLGYIILISILLGLSITVLLEITFFSAKRKNKDE